MRQMVRRAAAMLAVTAAMATTPAMAETEAFRAYADQLVERLAIGTSELAAAVAAGDLETAKEKWVTARFGWERGETFYGEYFPEHDAAIDFWPDAEQGFHAIEPLLFEAGDLEAAAAPTAALLASVEDLAIAYGAETFDRQGLLNGTAGLVFELGADKADGGESPFSDTSLTDMQNNMIGVETTYALVFAGPLAAADPALHETITGQMIVLASALDVPSIKDLDQPTVRQLSETLAVSLQDAAGPLGLEPPTLGG
jgi:iron uptake system EfeUOB component EfeO/EfeM